MVLEHNPIIARRFRAGLLESLHRGVWAVVDVDGKTLGGAGDPDQPIFARSSSKSLQGLGTLATGVVDRFGLDQQHVAVMVASHNGESVHESTVTSLLDRAGLDESVLRCGAAAPKNEPLAEARRTRHNCSGKHAGFLAAALALGSGVDDYLDPNSAVQLEVRAAVEHVCAIGPDDYSLGIDGCSAPTFVLPLRRLGQGIARVANPDGLPPEMALNARVVTDAVAAHPDLVAGRSPLRFDTKLIEASDGRLFSKGGADGVQVIGVVGAGIGFVGKSDDGEERGLLAVAIEALAALGHVDDRVRSAMKPWIDPIIRNADQLEVGHQQITKLRIGP